MLGSTLKSLLLSAAIMAAFSLAAWAVVHFGRRARQSEQKLRRLRIGLLAGGGLLAAYALVVDLELRRTTLLEVLIEPVGEIHTLRFGVEHVGVEHSLLLAPRAPLGSEAKGAVSLAVVLREGGGGGEEDAVRLLDEALIFETFVKGRGNRSLRSTWQSHTLHFTPRRACEHELVLELDQLPPVLQVRIEDPLKTDGERAQGF